MLELLTDPIAWLAFITLTALELVLGIDNIIFISILVDKLPKERREFARKLGLFIAMFMRIGLLMVLAWIVGLTAPIFTILNQEISGRDIILIAGGLFLIWKSTGEIHQSLEGEEGHSSSTVKATFTSVILQIMVIDLVFSLDSIITAVGMVDELAVMVAAVIASVALMMLFAGPIGRFVSAHPSIKILALAFLVAIGVILIAEGFDQHIPKGYIYTAMARAGVRGVDRTWIRSLYGFAIAPHLVFYLKIDEKTLIRRVLQARGMEYWESGMDMRAGDDIYENFRTYQRQLLKEYAAMSDEFGFRVIEGRKSITAIQDELRRQVGEFLAESGSPKLLESV